MNKKMNKAKQLQVIEFYFINKKLQLYCLSDYFFVYNYVIQDCEDYDFYFENK